MPGSGIGDPDTLPGVHDYEERLTVWRARSAAEAISRAEDDARSYAAARGAEYLGLAQAHTLPGLPGDGGEVFSLVRRSGLDPERYLDAFFDTGTEYQHSL